MAEQLINVKNLVKEFPVKAGFLNTNLGERAIALFVDILLLCIFNLIIFNHHVPIIGLIITDFIIPIPTIGLIITGWLYFALFESSGKKGSIGKIIMKIKITNNDETKINFFKSSFRFIVKFLFIIVLLVLFNMEFFQKPKVTLSIILIVLQLISYIMAYFVKKKRALHDIIANTVVITKSQMEGKTFVHAVDDISFHINRNEVLGLVGESGSGKSTTGRLLLNLIKPTKGNIIYKDIDLSTLKNGEIRHLRKDMTMVFQDPNASLSPRMSVGEAISHPLKIHKLANKKETEKIVLGLMKKVGLEPAEFLYKKYPHQLSGGQSQRVVLARALVTKPVFIVADEPISMADVSVRALIMELMKELKEEFHLTYLFITHDLATAKYLCDRIAVMYLGRIIEIGDKKSIFNNPHHPYTKALLEAVPAPDPSKRRTEEVVRGEIPSAINPPSGCHFHPRCKYATEECKLKRPPLREISEGHESACILPINY